jgi:tripartite-type tricarboxylate transporter receptor subunit TctC
MSTTLRTLAVLAVLLGATAAHAQAWPAKPVRWIVPYPPGVMAEQ